MAQCSRFVNADLIAAGLLPLAPERELLAASRLFWEIEACITQREDFAFETTLAGRSYLKLVRRLQTAGWRVELILPGAAQHGNVQTASPSGRRMAATISRSPTLNVALPVAWATCSAASSTQVDACRCFMNSDASPELVFEQQGEVRHVLHMPYYQHLLKEAER